MRHYLIFTVILLGILIVGVTAKLRWRIEPVALVAAPAYQIDNETESLQIVKSALEGGNLVITIKNNGRKPVVAYRIVINPKEEMLNDLTIRTPLAPGNYETAYIAYQSLEKINDVTRRVKITMALFDDATAEGDWDQARLMRERIEGASAAYQMIEAKMQGINRYNKFNLDQLAEDLDGCTVPPELRGEQRAGFSRAINDQYIQLKVITHPRYAGDREKGFNTLKKQVERQMAHTNQMSERRIK
jgi:hypothetical protein